MLLVIKFLFSKYELFIGLIQSVLYYLTIFDIRGAFPGLISTLKSLFDITLVDVIVEIDSLVLIAEFVRMFAAMVPAVQGEWVARRALQALWSRI